MAKKQSGGMDKMKGKAEEMAAKAAGDERMAGEGRADQAKGRPREAAEDARENMQGMRGSAEKSRSRKGKPMT